MNAKLIGLLAETFIHPGTDQDLGVVDNPVSREAATAYPFIAGSSMKGALRDYMRINQNENTDDIDSIFGKHENAGSILVSDARLLLLPVRSLSSAYKWVTCPLILERLSRDLKRSNTDFKNFVVGNINNKHYLGKGNENQKLFLEERNFNYQSTIPEGLVDCLQHFIPHEDVKARLDEQLVILSNDDFAWFARYGLPVQARNQLNESTKSSKNLWYEECLSPDTLMYFIISNRNTKNEKVSEITTAFHSTPYLQIGGNETIGQGWFAVQIFDGGNTNG